MSDVIQDIERLNREIAACLLTPHVCLRLPTTDEELVMRGDFAMVAIRNAWLLGSGA
jgi:hypothetical protein